MSGGGGGSRPLRILVDARLLRGGGIGRYLRELASHWLASPGVESLRLLGDPAELHRWLEELPQADRSKAEVVRWDDGIWSAAAQLRWVLRGRDWSAGCDAIFFPYWTAPAWRSAGEPPRVVAVHDLIQFLEPEGYPAWRRALGGGLLRRVVETAAAVVTVSEASARDLTAALPGVERRLRVIPNGVSEEFRAPGGSGSGEGGGPEPGPPYALVVGAIRPHKNLSRALRAAVAAGVELRHVGDPEVRDPALGRLLETEPRARATFRPLGPLPDAELRTLYEGAVALLHPAFREGFGLPVVEALACGCPVICSNRSSLPEVVGAVAGAEGGAGIAAVLLDPEDAEGWAGAVGQALEKWRAGALRPRPITPPRGWAEAAAAHLETFRTLIA